MYEAIKQLAQKYHQETINQRRDFHHFAERGWLEIRTACQIATTLENLGYEVLVGKEIMDKDARMGLPPEAAFFSYFVMTIFVQIGCLYVLKTIIKISLTDYFYRLCCPLLIFSVVAIPLPYIIKMSIVV